jgi:hypothetical protein
MKMMISTRADSATIAVRSRRRSGSLIVAQIAVLAAMLSAVTWTSAPAQAQFTPQGNRQVGTGYDELRPLGGVMWGGPGVRSVALRAVGVYRTKYQRHA